MTAKVKLFAFVPILIFIFGVTYVEIWALS